VLKLFLLAIKLSWKSSHCSVKTVEKVNSPQFCIIKTLFKPLLKTHFSQLCKITTIVWSKCCILRTQRKHPALEEESSEILAQSLQRQNLSAFGAVRTKKLNLSDETCWKNKNPALSCFSTRHLAYEIIDGKTLCRYFHRFHFLTKIEAFYLIFCPKFKSFI